MSNFFERALSASFNVIDCLQKKRCYLLFSISVAIAQFSYNWPGWSSRTVIPRAKNKVMCFLKVDFLINWAFQISKLTKHKKVLHTI